MITIMLCRGCPLRKYHRWADQVLTPPADLDHPSSPGRALADTHLLRVSSRCLAHSHPKGTATLGQAGTHRRACPRSNRTDNLRGLPRNQRWVVVEPGNQGN